MKIATKIIIISTILAFIFLSGTIYYIAGGTEEIFTDYIFHSAKEEVDVGGLELRLAFKNIQTDILSLSETPPIQGMFRALEGGGIDEEGNSTMEEWRDRLANIFSSLARSKEFYYQLRYIDEKGMEVVRVDYNGGEAVKTPEDKLQYKGDRFYFIEASKFKEKEIYVPRPSLNKEGNPPQLELPHNPVLRFATPVFYKNGERKGIIIANVSLESVFNEFKFGEDEFDDVFLIDEEGNYLMHQNKSKEWGGPEDLNTGENFKNDFPDIYKEVFENNEGSISAKDNIYFFNKTYLSPNNNSIFIVLFKNTSKENIFAPFTDLYSRAAAVGLISFFILFLVFSGFIKWLFRPLKDLAEGAGKIGAGDFSHRVNSHSRDELGKLALVFNSMAGNLEDLYNNLDKKVKERTREITRSKAEMKIISNRLKLATESAKIGIWEWDVKKNKLNWDDQMYKLYGMKREDFSGAYGAWRKGLYPEDAEKSDKEIKEALSGKKPFNTSFRVVWPDGSIHFIRAFALVKRDKKGEPLKMVGVNWDITAEREVDQAKTEFVSLASHQLRTPLTSMGWNAEMLLSGDAGKLTKEQKEYIDEIHKSNKVMSDLVNALLNVSRIDLGTFAIDPKPVNFREIAESVLKELEAKIKNKKHTIKTKYDKLPKIKADPQLLRIIFQNLLSNAVKYTPNKGNISLEILRDKKDILIKVSDTGYGIPKKQQEKIFSKLFRAENITSMDKEGTGLGLYIVKAIAEESGGKIWFKSEENKGTTFYVIIPLSGMKKKEGAKGLS